MSTLFCLGKERMSSMHYHSCLASTSISCSWFQFNFSSSSPIFTLYKVDPRARSSPKIQAPCVHCTLRGHHPRADSELKNVFKVLCSLTKSCFVCMEDTILGPFLQKKSRKHTTWRSRDRSSDGTFGSRSPKKVPWEMSQHQNPRRPYVKAGTDS